VWRRPVARSWKMGIRPKKRDSAQTSWIEVLAY